MNSYKIDIRATRTYTTCIKVDANSLDSAKERALRLADSGDCNWDLDYEDMEIVATDQVNEEDP